MRVQTFYRCALALPVLVPALVAVVVHGADIRPTHDLPRNVVQMLLASLMYGGVPYTVVAVWAAIWVDSRPESEIRRLALRAPLIMLVAWIPVCALFGLLSGSARMFAALVGLGAAVIVVFGYGYVVLVLLLRELLARIGAIDGPDAGAGTDRSAAIA